LDKITRTILFFSLIILMSLADTSCQSSKSASKSKSAVTGKAYVRKKSKSGNKRANHRSTTSAREAASRRSKSSPTPAKSKTTTSISTKAASGQATQVIKTARSYLGTPYRYGGSTGKGMDCSGLLCTSFASIDVKLPRTSTEQASYGKDVRLNDIAPGDLVFFAERKGSNKISHVGLVTVVKGKEAITFIHSSTSRGVVEDNLFGEYYQKIFVKAIRPF
jgi:cell wall-associated NlpC family hydrolase